MNELPLEKPLVNLRTMEDLKKVLQAQRLVTRQVKEEMLALVSDAELLIDPEQKEKEEASRCAAVLQAEEQKLLEKYANNPTLTEFNLMPNLPGGTKWGATFGVTLLVGELILEQVKVLQKDSFDNVIKRLLMVMLMELDAPKHQFLNESLEKAMVIRVSSTDGHPVTEAEHASYVRRVTLQVTESLLAVCTHYGLVCSKEDPEEGVQLTSLGKRVLLHLLDADKFVALLVEAHTRFSEERSKYIAKLEDLRHPR